METFAADGGVQPHSQPHSGSGKPADCTSNAHDQFPVDESPDADKHVRQDSHTTSQPNVLSSSVNNYAKITHTKCQIAPWRVDQLRPHPSYARLGIKVPASRLNALLEMGEDAFLFPLIVTSKGIVIDGHARLEIARLQGRATVECIEYNISEEEALRRLLLCHRPSSGLSLFSRIAMARDLAKSFKGKALQHQHAGGKSKGSSKLTEAQKVEVRKELAAAAGVSVGTLSHALEVLKNGDQEIVRALCNGEIKIDRAWKWSKESRKLPKEKFIKVLADQVPDKYVHSVRYYGVLAPRSRSRIFAIMFKLLGQTRRRRPRPRRLSWDEMILKYFGRNPRIDSRGQTMQHVGQYFPAAA